MLGLPLSTRADRLHGPGMDTSNPRAKRAPCFSLFADHFMHLILHKRALRSRSHGLGVLRRVSGACY
jgi:hypothetical protein